MKVRISSKVARFVSNGPSCEILMDGSPAETVGQKFPNPAVRILSCAGIVFEPMVEELSARLEVGMIKIVVGARVGDEFNRRSRAPPPRDHLHAVLRRGPIV